MTAYAAPRISSLARRVARTCCALFAASTCAAAAYAAPADTLVYCSEGSPESLNPQLMLSGTARNATATTIYDRLVDFRPGTTEIVPALAESWSISADQKTYLFRLRRGVKFHRTGFFKPTRDFNADDVLFSLNRQWRTDHPYHRMGGGNYQYFQGMGMDKLIVAVERVDAETVRIVLSRPDAPFLADLAMPFMSILSAEYGAKLLEQGRPEDIDTEPIGTGPYAFRSYVKDSMIRYDANSLYWRGAPDIAHLVFVITPNASVRVQKVRRGECQIAVAPPPAALPAIRQDKSLVLREQEGLNIGYLAMNTEKPPFNNVLVRRAVAHALNRQAYVDAIFHGTARPAINPYPPTLWSYTDRVRTYPHDPAKARALLAEAGYSRGFSATLWTLPVSRPYNPHGRTMGEMMQADLARVGIKVELVTYDWPTYLNKVKRGEHDMAQLGWSGDNGDPDNFLYTLFSCDAVTRGSNNARYCRADFNRLITDARATSDVKARSGLYARALAMLADDEPVVPLVHSTVFRLMSTRVAGYVMNPFDIDYFAGLTLKD